MVFFDFINGNSITAVILKMYSYIVALFHFLLLFIVKTKQRVNVKRK